MQSKLTKKDILLMSYTDFIGFINQWNVLPGAYVTLSKWIAFSNLNKKSRLLELACTSGFSSRELSVLTGCSGVGIDISNSSIEMAKYNKKKYAPGINMEYICQDGDLFSPKEKFSHIVVGAALKFFPNPRNTIKRITSKYLTDGGILFASPFYTIKNIPVRLVKQAKLVFGIDITMEKYKEIMQMYSGFEILYEDRCSIIKETTKELNHYCNSTTDRACKMRNIFDPALKKVMHDRLMEIKLMSNELRLYQMYTVLVLRYRSSIYPNRYIELF